MGEGPTKINSAYCKAFDKHFDELFINQLLQGKEMEAMEIRDKVYGGISSRPVDRQVYSDYLAQERQMEWDPTLDTMPGAFDFLV